MKKMPHVTNKIILNQAIDNEIIMRDIWRRWRRFSPRRRASATHSQSLQFYFRLVIVIVSQFQFDSAFGEVYVENGDLNPISKGERIASCPHSRYVNQSLTLHAHVDKRSKMSDVRDATRQLANGRKKWVFITLDYRYYFLDHV